MAAVNDAALARLLSRHPELDIEIAVDCLQASHGNVEAAHQTILKRKRVPQSSNRDSNLLSWLKPGSSTRPLDAGPGPSTQSSTRSSDAGPEQSTSNKRQKLDEPLLGKTRTINNVLKDVSTTPTSHPVRPPPLLLGTPALVSRHTPCTLLPHVLPPQLASLLYLEMLHENATVPWERTKWYLFEREVESPHTTFFYYDPNVPAFKDAALFWYNGRPSETRPLTPALIQARDYLEPIVNEHVRKRKRYPLEFAGDWKANVCAANCYGNAKEGVGYHSDRLNYLGPYATICSLSLGVTRKFRLRSVGDVQNRTFDISLGHNSLLIMHATCQEGFKHAIPEQKTVDLFRLDPNSIPKNANVPLPVDKDGNLEPFTQRINITFRFYRPDFSVAPNANIQDSIYPPLPNCQCGIPCVLRPDMKHKVDDNDPNGPFRYMWQCQAGSANSGKSCNHFSYLDMADRGPLIKDQLKCNDKSL